VSKVDLVYKTEVIDKSINFYSPRGYNAWAGDVVNFYHNGVYHLLYLYDRHHHGSRWGSGAHTMHHITTKDFITWEEQVPLVSLDKQWKTLGTGTMFYYGGKYYFSHGWHTSRNVPKELLGSTHLKEYYDKNGVFNAVSYKELDNLGFLPNGATYEISDDGINFYPSNVQIHIAENPSIFVNGDKLNLVAGYGCNGTMPFAETWYWGEVSDGTFVYNNQSLLYPHVENYKTYMRNLGVDVKEASIPSLEQVSYDEILQLLNDINPTTFWVGSNYYGNLIVAFAYYAADLGEYIYDPYVYFDGHTAGVRPVIVVPQSEIG
jgi:hypothetical protein